MKTIKYISIYYFKFQNRSYSLEIVKIDPVKIKQTEHKDITN